MPEPSLPGEFMGQFEKDRLNTVDQPEVKDPEGDIPDIEFPAPRTQPGQPAQSPAGPEPDDYDPMAGGMEEIETRIMAAEAGGMSRQEQEDFAELLVDAVALGKDTISTVFESKFEAGVSQAFKAEEKPILNLIMSLDQDGQLSHDKLESLKDKYPFEQLLDVKVRYIREKKRWQATEFKEYQKEGIRRNAIRVAEKYFVSHGPDPLLMLGIYIAVSLGADVARIVTNMKKAA